MDESRKIKSKKTIVKETNLGLYLWQLPNGDLLADEDGNFLNIPAKYGDFKRMKIITDTARNLGYDGGPVWYEGSMRCTEEEYYEQIARMIDGYIPNKYDIGSYKDDIGRGAL